MTIRFYNPNNIEYFDCSIRLILNIKKETSVKILIVEDNNIDQYIFEAFLKSYGICDFAKNGNIALKKFEKSYRKNNPYDIIFLDIIIPKICGYEVLSIIRNYEKMMNNFDQVKIVMVSSLNDLKNIKKAFQKKCNAYITKPVYHEVIDKTIKDLGLLSVEP